MSFDVENFVIDRPLRGHMYDYSGKLRWMIDQIKDPKLSASGTTVYAKDAQDVNVMAFERSKDAKLEGTNAVFSTSLYADQMGTEKDIASDTDKKIMTCFEILKVNNDATTLTLTHVPHEAVAGVPFKFITALSNDKTRVADYELGATVTTNFSVSSKTVTLPTGTTFKAGDLFAVKYQYESTKGIVISDMSDKHSDYGEFMLEVLAYSPCDRATVRAINIIFPNAKLDNNVDLTMNNEMSQPFSISAVPDYCAEDKKLFRVEFPGE